MTDSKSCFPSISSSGVDGQGEEATEERLVVVDFEFLDRTSSSLSEVPSMKVRMDERCLNWKLDSITFNGVIDDDVGSLVVFEKDDDQKTCHFIGVTDTRYKIDGVKHTVNDDSVVDNFFAFERPSKPVTVGVPTRDHLVCDTTDTTPLDPAEIQRRKQRKKRGRPRKRFVMEQRLVKDATASIDRLGPEEIGLDDGGNSLKKSKLTREEKTERNRQYYKHRQIAKSTEGFLDFNTIIGMQDEPDVPVDDKEKPIPQEEGQTSVKLEKAL